MLKKMMMKIVVVVAVVVVVTSVGGWEEGAWGRLLVTWRLTEAVTN